MIEYSIQKIKKNAAIETLTCDLRIKLLDRKKINLELVQFGDWYDWIYLLILLY